MKKKVKDLTVGKLYEYCKEKESCDDCPFRNFNYYCTLNTPYDLEEDALEQEVEIPDARKEENMKKKVEELTILDLINMAKAYGAYAEKVVLKKEKQDDSDFFFVFEMGFFEKDKVKIGEISVELGNSDQLEEEDE